MQNGSRRLVAARRVGELHVRVDAPAGTAHAGPGGADCLFLHGFGEGGFVWDEFVGTLSPPVRALVADLRGHGDSGWDPTGAYGLDMHVSDVLRVIETFCAGMVVLVGHSLGAQIALRIAARRPDRVGGLVIVDFAPQASAAARSAVRQGLAESLHLYRSMTEYASWLGATRPLMPLAAAKHIASQALRAHADGTFSLKVDPRLACLADEHMIDGGDEIWSELAAVQAPTLVVRGAGSAFLSRGDAQRMAASVRDGRVCSVKAAGHAVMTDNPEGFAEAVAPFLDALARGLTLSAAAERGGTRNAGMPAPRDNHHGPG